MVKRLVLTAATVAVLALAGCGRGDSSSPSETTGTAASVTDTSPPSPVVTETSDGTKPAGGTGEPAQAAPCTTTAMSDVVASALGVGSEGRVEIAECRGGYARAFYHPEAANLETEQLFLVDVDGAWTVLTYGTGIECTDDDLRPAELETACVALGLRPAASPADGAALTLDEVNARVLRETTGDMLGTATAFSCEPYHGGLTTGGVLICRPDPEPTEGQFPILTALVLDGGAGTIAWARAGVENPTLNADGLVSGSGALPRGLNCTDLVAHPAFVADIANRLDPTLTYFAVVLYWFLEDRPTPRMDIDSNGIPCETLFPADVVQRVWGGGYLT